MKRPFLFLLALAPAALFAAVAGGCATGGASGPSASGDGGDDASVDGVAPGDGGMGGDGKSGEGGANGTSLAQACTDNVSQYCQQLSMCSPFLVSIEYGDVVTCQTRLGPAYCNNIVTAKGSGWTGDGLEACVRARAKLSCTDFLYLRPAPAACRPTGTLSTQSCLFDSQCGTGYCRTPGGGACGNCVQRGTTGAPCTTTSDCDGNLVCSGPAGATTCVAPQPLDGVCSATSPCQSGMACVSGKCAQPGNVGATCSADAGGVDCDYNLGAYCSGTACAAVSVGTLNSSCGGTAPPVSCLGDGVCQGGICVLPIADGQPCDGGLGCTTPSTCSAGTCSTPSAAQCP